MSFLSAYTEGKLADFFRLAPSDIAGALELPRSKNRAELVTALRRYAISLDAPKMTLEALEKLEHPKARAVVTGQQAGLLLGPNYTLSKAITAINLAKEHSTENQPVVPIFWVASQDHDVEEVNHSYLLDMSETLHRLEIDLPKDTPIGKITMQEAWVSKVIQVMQKLSFPEISKEQGIYFVEQSATKAKTFADWFASMLYQLLGQHGLIIINPLESDIAPLFKPIIEAELENPTASSLLINQAGEKLRSLGFEPQLSRANHATNLFIEEDSKRQLLKFDGKRFYSDKNQYSLNDLKMLLENDPTLLTPAAGLRPITQDSILPTAITVLGPGELRYFAQLRGVYDLHQVPMSLAWPRATATILEPPVVRIMEKFGLNFDELSNHFQKIKAEKLLELHGYGQAFEKTHHTLETSLMSLAESLKNIDPTLLGTLQRSEGHLRKTLGILKNKSAKALETQDTITTHQFNRLENYLFPLGTPQERLISPLSFFLKFGIQSVMQALLSLPTQGNHQSKL